MSDIIGVAHNLIHKIESEGYNWGYEMMAPQYGGRSVACSTYIGWVLHEMGLTDQPVSGLPIYDIRHINGLADFLERHHFQKITDKSQLQKGDIVLVTKFSGKVASFPTHSFIFVEWDYEHSNPNLCKRYDAGSWYRITQIPQPYVEHNDDLDYFYCAYRITEETEADMQKVYTQVEIPVVNDIETDVAELKTLVSEQAKTITELNQNIEDLKTQIKNLLPDIS